MLHFDPNDILIDRECINAKLDWCKGDTPESATPYDKPISYNFNSKGYRTKEIEDLQKDFILTFGCSYTQGIGLAKEDMWAELLAQELNMDLLNLGVGGTGPDIIHLNTLQYTKLNYPKPKCVVVQWPQSTRKSFAYKDTVGDGICLMDRNVQNTFDHTHYEKKDSSWYFERYITETGELEVNNYIWYTAVNSMWRNYDVPVVNWTYDDDFLDEEHFDITKVIIDQNYRKARDGKHEGPGVQKYVVKRIVSKVKDFAVRNVRESF